MRIQGKLKAEIVKLVNVWNQANDGKTAQVDIDVTVTQPDCERVFGDALARLAFATMTIIKAQDDDGQDEIAHLADTLKPGRKLVAAKHVIIFGDVETIAQPKVMRVTPVQGEERVTIRIRVPVDAGAKKLRNLLWDSVGQTVDVSLNPQQQSLPLKSVEAA